jgi:hypothetical protein
MTLVCQTIWFVLTIYSSRSLTRRGFQVLAAQTRLAQELYRRPELYDVYLIELLTLFADKGVAIQNVTISNHHVKVCQASKFGCVLLTWSIDGGYD